VGIDFAVLVSELEFGLEVLALLGFLEVGSLLFVKLNIIVLVVPLSERSRVDVHNGVLDEGLRAHKLVVRRVVDSVDHTGLAGAGLRSPGEAAVVKTPSAVLEVASTTTHESDFFGAELGQSRHSAHLELSLFLVNWHAASGGPSLVPRVPRNTHTS